MLDQMLEIFGIVPDTDLDLMEPNQSLGRFTARAIAAVDNYLGRVKPDIVLIQGDTTTVVSAALAAFYQGIPVGHVEAGLRTGNMQAPWPEEANRMLTSKLAHVHFAPTEEARNNLRTEGISESAIMVTGNTVIDALYLALKRTGSRPVRVRGLPFDWESLWCDRIVLVTSHRRESMKSGFDTVCKSIKRLAITFPGYQFVFPVHMNPKLQEPIERILRNASLPNVHIIEPIEYLGFVRLMAASRIIITDSGGIQEEAPSLGKPVLVLRETTERPEAVEAGTVRLVGVDRERIIDGVTELLRNEGVYERMARAHNPYGDGNAASRILRWLMDNCLCLR